MTVEFFTNPMSRGQIARWMLEESGLDYTERLIAYGPEMKSEEYLGINPMGKVPAIRHDGKVVTEAAAICAYLGEVSNRDLAPHADERADFYRWLFFAAGPVEQAVTARSMGWSPKGNEQEGMAGFGSYSRTVDVLDAFLSGRDYVCGPRFTAADVYVGSQVDWGVAFDTLPKRDAFVAYAERLRERPAYKKAKARDTELIAKMQAESGTE